MHAPPAKTVAIVGGGISGLAAAYYLTRQRPGWRVRVFEKEAQGGGKLMTSFREGFTFDGGPNGFLTNVPETLDLAKSLGLDGELQAASDLAKHRFIFRDGGLRPLPTSPPAFLKSDLLSPLGKVRAGLEPFQPVGSTEETVYAFIARRFGKEVADTFAGVAVLGVTAGDAKQLSLDALFPRFRQLEREHGSLLRGLVRAQREAKASLRPSTRLTSFEGGIAKLVSALEHHLSPHLNYGCAVCSLAKERGGYTLTLSDGKRVAADSVVLATPAFAAAPLLAPFSPKAAETLRAIPYADVAVFGLGYDRIDVPHPLNGFGFLVPRGEGVRSLGVLFSSSLFPDRAPEGKVALRVICGGTHEPDFLDLSDEEALDVVRRDLRVTMGITQPPEVSNYTRWPKGIPQYLVGHRQKVEKIRQDLPAGLFLIGNAYDGVGVNDCVRGARQVVDRLTANTDSRLEDSLV